MKYLWIGFIKLIRYREQVQALFKWIARFGYLAFLIYGMIEWFRPGALQERLYRRRTLLYCLFAVSVGSGISFVVGHIWCRNRPFIAHAEYLPLIPHKDNASFPSNHSMNAMAASLILLSRKNNWGVPFLLWSLVLGTSRVVCRLHYISDVIGGFLLGACCAGMIRQSRLAKQLATQLLWFSNGIAEGFRCWRSRW